MFSSSQKPYNMHDKNNEFTKKQTKQITLCCLFHYSILPIYTVKGCGTILVRHPFIVIKDQACFICALHTMTPFGILHFQFPFWNCTTQLYTTQLLCIWPPPYNALSVETEEGFTQIKPVAVVLLKDSILWLVFPLDHLTFPPSRLLHLSLSHFIGCDKCTINAIVCMCVWVELVKRAEFSELNSFQYYLSKV